MSKVTLQHSHVGNMKSNTRITKASRRIAHWNDKKCKCSLFYLLYEPIFLI